MLYELSHTHTNNLCLISKLTHSYHIPSPLLMHLTAVLPTLQFVPLLHVWSCWPCRTCHHAHCISFVIAIIHPLCVHYNTLYSMLLFIKPMSLHHCTTHDLIHPLIHSHASLCFYTASNAHCSSFITVIIQPHMTNITHHDPRDDCWNPCCCIHFFHMTSSTDSSTCIH